MLYIMYKRRKRDEKKSSSNDVGTGYDSFTVSLRKRRSFCKRGGAYT